MAKETSISRFKELSVEFKREYPSSIQLVSISESRWSYLPGEELGISSNMIRVKLKNNLGLIVCLRKESELSADFIKDFFKSIYEE
ncbi:MAG: hypothetical protein P9L98_02095 [Candidatus Kaelpia imicola]|nr:hypothetical protein [Candidatus Kaelpia imicola]